MPPVVNAVMNMSKTATCLTGGEIRSESAQGWHADVEAETSDTDLVLAYLGVTLIIDRI